jgi:NADH-quinone oxidoreductase subunit C
MSVQAADVAPIVEAVAARLPGAVAEIRSDRGQAIVYIAPEAIVDVCRFLKEEQQFERLAGITAVDWYPLEPRFEVVYFLHSLSRQQRLRLKCRVAEEQAELDSLTAVWRSANWYEREVFDLFGIRFRGHPNLRRIMLPEDWEGHPLRKDYPVHGFKYGYKDES